MTTRNEDFLFAQEAQALGYVTEQQVEEGFLLQRRLSSEMQIDERLAVILVKRGWMSEEQARRVYTIIEPEGARSEIEGYRILERVGRGAMGTVYKALHKGLQRVVAIKVLRRDLGEDRTQIERLKREAKLLADLDHPNIVRAFDAGESNGFPYLVMEYVEGESLRDRILREGPLEEETALAITRAIADALERARRMGVVHRDIKPGNILLARNGTPKLMDLGLAKGPIDAGLTQMGATVGTPQFISPEQAVDPRKADIRSDIYSLGATLYNMVVGRPPFEGATLAEIITKVLYRQPSPPRLRNPRVSPELGHLIERMMLKDPALRYRTPAEVVADIDLIRGGRSIIPAGFTGNWEAFLLRRRYRQRAWIAAAVAVGVLGVGGGAWWQVSRTRTRDAQARLLGQAEALLADAQLSGDEPRAEVRRALRDARARREALEQEALERGLPVPRSLDLEQRLTWMAELDRALEGFERLAEEVTRDVGERRYGRAVGRVDAWLPGVQVLAPAARRGAQLRGALLTASEARWREAAAEVRGRPVASLAEFAAQWAALREALEADWVDTPSLRQARQAARALDQGAQALARRVADVSDDFGAARARPRIEALELRSLDREFHESRQDVKRVLPSLLAAFREHAPQVAPATVDGLVERELLAIELRLRTQVEEHWAALKREIGQRLDGGDRVGATEAARAFADAADGAGFVRLREEAEELARRLEAEARAHREASFGAWQETLRLVLDALRALDAPAARRAIEAADAAPTLEPPDRARVRALRAVPEALESVLGGALGRLAELARSQGRIEALRVRAPPGTGGERYPEWRRLEVLEVEAAPPAFTARGRAPGSRSTAGVRVRIPLSQVHPEDLAALAAQAGAAPHPLAAALLDLFGLEPVADRPGVDLRRLAEGYARVQQRLEAQAGGTALAEVVGTLRAELQRLQERRESEAAGHLHAGQYYMALAPPRYRRAHDHFSLLVDPAGRLLLTQAMDPKSLETVRRHLQVCEEEIRRDQLGALVPGVHVEERPDGQHALEWDFEEPEQMALFDRIFGVVEVNPHRVTSPSPTARRLHLLRGLQGVVRDRELSLRSPFDPARPLEVEFNLDVGVGSIFFGVDLDGVAVCVCSADPNYWKWQVRRDAPLLEGETELPALDALGRGRGVAFHAGPDFGISFPLGGWDWPSLGAGRNHAAWRDAAYLERHRARLFAFAPRDKPYRVRVVRQRERLELHVDGELIVERSEPAWAERGGTSDLEPRMRNGSGRIQVLTWTPAAIDDLRITGTLRPSWIRAREALREGQK